MSDPAASPAPVPAPDPAPRCPNCGGPVPDRFCGRCGQKAGDHRRPLLALLGDLQDQLFGFDSRTWRTLVALVRRPGLLTVEYNAGRRMRFVPPVRLYLVVSFFFFLALQLANPSIVKITRGPSSADLLPPPPASEEAEAERPQGRGLFGHFLTKLGEIDRRTSDAEGELNRLVSRRIPQTMFFLVPLLALILKLLYLRRRRFYVEHLVCAVHLHSFGFLTMLVALIARAAGGGALAVKLFNGMLLACVVLHLWLALRRVYGQSWLATTVKAGLAVFLYGMSLFFALLVVAFVTVLLA